MSRPMTLWRLGWLLIWHHLAGWKIRPDRFGIDRDAEGGGVSVVLFMERSDG